MQYHTLPIKVYDAIDKMVRDFLRGLTDERKRMHMESWNTMSLPKDLEGLGIYSVKHRNQAILAKLYWRLANDEESP